MKIYIVHGQTGEYSDRTEWTVKAFSVLIKAQELVTKASGYSGEIQQKVKNGEIKYWDVHGSPYDEKMEMDYTGTNYYISEVELEE